MFRICIYTMIFLAVPNGSASSPSGIYSTLEPTAVEIELFLFLTLRQTYLYAGRLRNWFLWLLKGCLLSWVMIP